MQATCQRHWPGCPCFLQQNMRRIKSCKITVLCYRCIWTECRTDAVGPEACLHCTMWPCLAVYAQNGFNFRRLTVLLLRWKASADDAGAVNAVLHHYSEVQACCSSCTCTLTVWVTISGACHDPAPGRRILRITGHNWCTDVHYR